MSGASQEMVRTLLDRLEKECGEVEEKIGSVLETIKELRLQPGLGVFRERLESNVIAFQSRRATGTSGGGGCVASSVPAKPNDRQPELPFYPPGGMEESRPIPPEAVRTHLSVLQDELVAIIDAHYDTLKDGIDSMGCKGDCYLCPHPDYPTREEQVPACLESVRESLGITVEKPVDTETV